MDLVINCNLKTFLGILRELGFKVKNKDKYFEAIKLDHLFYRFHIYIIEKQRRQSPTLFCEIHYDFFLHFLFLGVDYKKKPFYFFKHILEPIFKKRNITYMLLNGMSWKTRHNTAILKGFDLK